MNIKPVLGFIGFGEVAYNFAKGFREAGIDKIFAYDAAKSSTNYRAAIDAKANKINVVLLNSLDELADKTDIIFSTVHGNVAKEVASQIAPFLKSGMLYADINNTSPATKRSVAEIVFPTGAKFIDLELFETPARAMQKSFLMASGNGAKEFCDRLKNFGMTPKLIEGISEKACEIKTLANIYYKGIQALSLEIAVSARKAGISLDLIAPLATKPVENIQDEKQLHFWITRGALHAERKAAELIDTNDAMRDWGTDPIMITAAIKRFALFADINLREAMGPDFTKENCDLIMERAEQNCDEKNIKFE